MKLLAIAVCIVGAIFFQNCAFAQRLSNEVPIVFQSSDEIVPESISFENNFLGDLAFTKSEHFYRGEVSGTGAWLNHLISLHYPNFSLPLELRTWHKLDELRLSGQLWNVHCDKEDVRRIRNVGMYSSHRDIIEAIIAARYISEMSARICPANITHDMRQIYFNLSCNFAKKVAYFVLSEDAKHALITSVRDGAAQAASCEVQSKGMALKELDKAHKLATEDEDWELADSYMSELRLLIDNPDWAQAFQVVGIDRTSIEALRYKRIYLRSLEASNDGNYYKALALNKRLQSDLLIGLNQPAFEAIKLDSGRLKNDAGFFEARMAEDDLSH